MLGLKKLTEGLKQQNEKESKTKSDGIVLETNKEEEAKAA